MTKKKIYNPVTGTYYDVKLRSSKYGKNGEIRGLWKLEEKEVNPKKSVWELFE